jgi:hypothetical protein
MQVCVLGNDVSAMNGSGVEEVMEAVARISLLPKRRDSGHSSSVFDRRDLKKSIKKKMSIKSDKRRDSVMASTTGGEKCSVM